MLNRRTLQPLGLALLLSQIFNAEPLCTFHLFVDLVAAKSKHTGEMKGKPVRYVYLV